MGTACAFLMKNKILFSAPTRQAFSRTYGRFFAEFLNELSPVRLGVLHQPTCVGFRYALHMIGSQTLFWEARCAGFLLPYGRKSSQYLGILH